MMRETMGDEEIGPKDPYERVAVLSNEDDEEEEEKDGIFIHRREDNDNNEDENGSFVTASQSVVLMNGTSGSSRRRRTLFPDNVLQIAGVRIVEGTFSIKFAKFLVLTYLGIVATFYVVRYMGLEHRHGLLLRDVWQYEANAIFMDCLVFFTVGRLWQQRGVDNLEFIGIAMAANVYTSYVATFPMFRYSATLYEMHCRWPLSLWIFVLCLVPFVAGIGILHLRKAVVDGILVQKCTETLLVNVFCLLPLVTSGYFHLHHWFAGWLLGMHINFHQHRWSRYPQYWCWGCYMNGIGVWGRDPVLTCAYALFMAQTQRCPFVHCYLEALAAQNATPNETIVVEMRHSDWRNCSDSGYHP